MGHSLFKDISGFDSWILIHDGQERVLLNFIKKVWLSLFRVQPNCIASGLNLRRRHGFKNYPNSCKTRFRILYFIL